MLEPLPDGFGASALGVLHLWCRSGKVLDYDFVWQYFEDFGHVPFGRVRWIFGDNYLPFLEGKGVILVVQDWVRHWDFAGSTMPSVRGISCAGTIIATSLK